MKNSQGVNNNNNYNNNNNSADHRVKIKESGTINKYLDLTREQRKLWNIKMTVKPIVVGVLELTPKGLEKNHEGIGNQRKNQDYTDHSITEIGQNTK